MPKRNNPTIDGTKNGTINSFPCNHHSSVSPTFNINIIFGTSQKRIFDFLRTGIGPTCEDMTTQRGGKQTVAPTSYHTIQVGRPKPSCASVGTVQKCRNGTWEVLSSLAKATNLTLVSYSIELLPTPTATPPKTTTNTILPPKNEGGTALLRARVSVPPTLDLDHLRVDTGEQQVSNGAQRRNRVEMMPRE